MMTFNLKSYLEKSAAKKDKGVVHTELQLRNKPAADVPGQVSEVQLEKHRVETEPVLMEKKLEKVRTGSDHTLTEGRLDASKSKLVQHRNAEAYTGNINKVEEQRLSRKPVEKEKYEPANVTEKDGQYPLVKGKDGLQTANSKQKLVKAQRRRPVDLEDFSISTVDDPKDVSGVTPSSLSEFEMDMPDIQDEDTADLIDDLTRDVQLPRESELSRIERDIVPEDEGEAPIFEIGETRVVDAGGTQVSQVDITFDPFVFNSDAEAYKEAMAFIKSQYKNLSAKQIRDSIVVDMNTGKITLNLAAEPIASAPVQPPKPLSKATV